MNNCSCENNTSENNRSRNELLNQIMSYNFAVNDLALYLDTHPTDSKAICLHNEYSQRANNLAAEYQRLYGPLTINFASENWNWIDEPWPWERGAY